jgi:hypothetical protein
MTMAEVDSGLFATSSPKYIFRNPLKMMHNKAKA